MRKLPFDFSTSFVYFGCRLLLLAAGKGKGLITLVAQLVFIEYAAGSLICDICNPDAADADPRRLHLAVHVGPKWLVQLLGER